MSLVSDPELEEMTQLFLHRCRADGERLLSLAAPRPAPMAEERMAEIWHIAHRLAGSAGTFGFMRLSEKAHALDALIIRGDADPSLVRDRLSAVVAEIDRTASEPR